MSKNFIFSVDLGQVGDYTAFSVLELVPTPGGKDEDTYHVRHLERLPLGMPYPAQVAKIKALMSTPQLRGHTELVVDATGVGRAVVDLIRSAGLYPIAITITGGDTVNREDYQNIRVPKRDLVAVLTVLLQTERLQIAASLPDAAVLTQELLGFQMRITPAANDVYGGREGEHDDLVLVVALGCWRGENLIRAQIFV